MVWRIGSYGSEPGKFFVPWDVAVSAGKHIFVVDERGRLRKFSFSSTYLASYNTTSYGVAVHPTIYSGKVFSTNWAKCIITVLNADLTFSHSFGGKEMFTGPNGMAIDTKGMVYVSRGEVFKFTPEGKPLTIIGSRGEQPHQFGKLWAISVDSNDIMYIMTVANTRL